MSIEQTTNHILSSPVGRRNLFSINSIYRGYGDYPSMLQEAGLKLGDKVLDVGTGMGAVYYSEMPNLPSMALGFDIDRQFLVECQQDKNLADNLDPTMDATRIPAILRILVQGSAYLLPFKGGTFDIAIDSWLMPYLSNSGYGQMALAEYHRVVKVGGRLIINPSKKTGWETEKARQVLELGIEEWFSIRERKKLKGSRNKDEYWVLTKDMELPELYRALNEEQVKILEGLRNNS
jgi:ubiquinone/menaquinone biosynthesis C-methylase UbiE